MGQGFLLDTNAVVDYFGAKLPAQSMLKMHKIVNEEFNVSAVVKIETLGFNGLPADMQKLESLISIAKIYYLDDDIIEKTIILRKILPKCKLGDAIIAATALVYNFQLITRNIHDFKNIPGLQIMNPYEL